MRVLPAQGRCDRGEPMPSPFSAVAISTTPACWKSFCNLLDSVEIMNEPKPHKLALPLIAASVALVAGTVTVPVGEFSQRKLEEWEGKEFKGRTNYALVVLDDRGVLRAESHAGASGLVRKIRIDLEKTPYLNWSWRIENILGQLKEQTKAGDDYPARIYVVVSGGLAFWRTRSLNYVWASTTPQGKSWPNAYAGNNVIMLAQRSGEAGLGEWRGEKRDVRADFKAYFGESIRYIDAVALMTDTDDSKAHAVAYYGDIYFSSE